MDKQQLASRVWETANNLRSKIKANEYKDYILGFMFYKFVSDYEEQWVISAGGTVEDLKDDSAKDMIQTGIGYFIGYDNLFSTFKKMGNSLTAGVVSEALTDFNRNIDPAYIKVFDNIFSTLQGGLSKFGDSSSSRDKAVRDMIDLISDIPTTNNNYDVLGYIYEFLIFKFSTAAKDDGAFYTPHEVSALIARIIADALKDKDKLDIYDPTSGSGSLLLNIGTEASKYIDNNKIKYYAQEKITETYHLTRMNLIMKGIGVPNIFVRNGDTLDNDWPYFDNDTAYQPLLVDAVVSNPPYSLHWEPSEKGSDPRFKYGLAPVTKADYAFLQHCLFHLKNDGIMAIVLPHGVLFRASTEGTIRKNLIDNNHIETIIGLPSNLFYSTGIPTIIMILRKNRTNGDILFVDASQSFTKDKNQNVLTEKDIQKIFDAVRNRKNIDNFSRLVEKSEIIDNDYNLNIPRYVNATPKAEKYDLYSIMNGLVSDDELSQYNKWWDAFPALKYKLFVRLENGYNNFVDTDINDTIWNDDDVKAFVKHFTELSDEYKLYLIKVLVDGYESTGYKTRDEIVSHLFEIFGFTDLVDKYLVYQNFADNWDKINSDLITIRDSGIGVCRQTEPNIVLKKDTKAKKSYETQDGWKGTIIPFSLIEETFFGADFEKINSLSSKADALSSQYTDTFDNLDEELQKELANKDGTSFDTKLLNQKIKDKETPDDIVSELKSAVEAKKEEKALRKQIKEIASSLGAKAKEKVESLTDEELINLLVKKWIMPLVNGSNTVCNNSINAFVKDLTTLKAKYASNLIKINADIEKASKELASLMDQLTGSETDMLALQMLKNALI